jgi:hypothetical protein
MKWPITNTDKQRGSALLAIIIMLPFLILIIALYMELSVASFNNSRGDQYRTHSQFATDAGTDYAVDQINADPEWTGTVTPVELHNDGAIRTTFEITVEDADEDTKTITSIGKTYTPVSSSTPKSSVTIKTDLRKVTSGNFSIVTGVGGLFMSNSAKILGGDVLVNGEVSMSNSSQIGLSTSPVNLSVAHQICPEPPNASYPQVCGSGENGQPISISGTAHIYGDVKANNQTSSTGMSNPGLTASSGVTPQSLPVHDRDAQKAAVASTITSSAANCSSGTRIWSANLKITGNVVISNTCQVTVQGDVWITGTLEVRNSAQLIVADTLGSTRPNIMVDGSVVNFRNSALLKSNASDTGFQVITYRSSPSCSPDCTNVTGQELYNSRNLTTISLSQSASGPHTVFYARWTRVTVANSGQIGALVGQTVELSNSGTITFGTSVGTSTSFWVVDTYRRTFN